MSEQKQQLAIYDILRNRFPANEYALVQEVSDKTGGRNRSADYFAINLWPSRGLAFHCLEQKKSRADWLNELKNPEKQERHIKYCDYFWLLTTDEKIAKLEEIPTNWGWLNIKNNRIYTIKNAPKLQPQELDVQFVCALLRRACDLSNFVHKDSLNEIIELKVEQKLRNERNQLEIDINTLTRENESLKRVISEFETASGYKITHDWRSEFNAIEVGTALNKLLKEDRSVNNIEIALTRLKDQSDRILNTIKNEISNLLQNPN